MVWSKRGETQSVEKTETSLVLCACPFYWLGGRCTKFHLNLAIAVRCNTVGDETVPESFAWAFL